MKTFLYLISIFWLIFGIIAIISPIKLSNFYKKLLTNIKPLFILPLTCGILLLWAHPVSSLGILIKVVGILSLLKGIYILVCPMNVLSSTLSFWLSKPEPFWRVYGAIAVLLGVVVGWSVL